MRISDLLRCLGIVTLGSYIIIGFTPFVNVLASHLMVDFELVPADAVVVLGGGLAADGEMGAASLKRAVRGMELYHSGYAPLLALLGPKSIENYPSEASVRRSLALTMQIPPENIVTESRGLTTLDEARLMKEVLTPMGVRRILLVSDSQHLIRASLLFENEGFKVFGIPANTIGSNSGSPSARLNLMEWIVREQAARFYYHLSGYL